MEVLGALAIVLVVFAAALKAIRADARFDRREITIQIAWIGAYLAGCATLMWGLRPLAARIGLTGAASIGIATIVLSMVVLARHLQRRLARRAR